MHTKSTLTLSFQSVRLPSPRLTFEILFFAGGHFVKPLRLAALLLCVLIALCALSGCGSNSLIASASFRPATLSPNGDGQADATQIDYALNRAARVSIYLQDASGNRYYFRKDQPRPAGTYSVL